MHAQVGQRGSVQGTWPAAGSHHHPAPACSGRLPAAPARPAAQQQQRRGRRQVLVRADYYSLLGVEKGADKKAIKQAYRQSARKYHPVR